MRAPITICVLSSFIHDDKKGYTRKTYTIYQSRLIRLIIHRLVAIALICSNSAGKLTTERRRGDFSTLYNDKNAIDLHLCHRLIYTSGFYK